MPADGLPVTIVELGPPFRNIALAGRDAPERPVKRKGSQRATQTHYPGSQQASVQVMGTREDPLVLRGWFQDPLTFLDGGPEARMSVLRGMMQGQGLCQLVWGSTIICQGRVEVCDFDIHKSTRVRYEITFAVDQANEAVALEPKQLVPSVFADLKSVIDVALASAEQAIEAVDRIKTVEGLVT
jgi:hypothetical protein